MSSLRVSGIGENISVAMAVITLEGANDTRMGFNTFHITNLCTSDSYTCKVPLYDG